MIIIKTSKAIASTISPFLMMTIQYLKSRFKQATNNCIYVYSPYISEFMITWFLRLLSFFYNQPFLPLWQHQKAKELGNQHRNNKGVERYKDQSIKHNHPNSQTRNNQSKIQITQNVNNHTMSKQKKSEILIPQDK